MNKVLFREFSETSSRLWPQEPNLLTRHDFYFENCIADTPELIEMAYALRYQVYVTERQFENADEHADGLETDQFDSHSRLGLVFHRPTGEALGTVRLIQPVKGDPDSLPIAGMLRRNGFDICDYVAVDRTQEISRFAISKRVRRRITDEPGAAAVAPLSREERIRRGSLVCLSLMQLMLRNALVDGTTYCTAVMEEKLLRMLASMGLHLKPIGPLVFHLGLRQPSFSYIPEMLERCKREQRDFWDVITNCGELTEKLDRMILKQTAMVC